MSTKNQTSHTKAYYTTKDMEAMFGITQLKGPMKTKKEFKDHLLIVKGGNPPTRSPTQPPKSTLKTTTNATSSASLSASPNYITATRQREHHRTRICILHCANKERYHQCKNKNDEINYGAWSNI